MRLSIVVYHRAASRSVRRGRARLAAVPRRLVSVDAAVSPGDGTQRVGELLTLLTNAESLALK